jgi:DNA-binding CsgD family transcriptional regulator
MTFDQIKALIVPLIGSGIFNKQEDRVLRLRWVEGKTLQESGAALDVTRERIRQIEANALRKYQKAGIQIVAKEVVAVWRLPMSMENETKFLDAIDRLEDALEFCNRE